MWQLKFGDKYVRYFDVPQNFDTGVGGTYYIHELQTLRNELAELAGREISDEDITDSIRVYNENRQAVCRLYECRAARPWQFPTAELFLLIRAGLVLPVEEHTRLIDDYLSAADAEERPVRDNCRVVVTGMFCEQPPLALIKSIEMAGCYIVDDDLLLVMRWLLEDVPLTGDPIENLSEAFLQHSTETSARYVENKEDKGKFLIESVRRNQAEGVIFAAPSFCDPALLERPMLQKALLKESIPSTAFKYAENSGQMQPIREQAGTFADSIKLWSEA
jgi:benzoyl-CoA reductase subunit C